MITKDEISSIFSNLSELTNSWSSLKVTDKTTKVFLNQETDLTNIVNNSLSLCMKWLTIQNSKVNTKESQEIWQNFINTNKEMFLEKSPVLKEMLPEKSPDLAEEIIKKLVGLMLKIDIKNLSSFEQYMKHTKQGLNKLCDSIILNKNVINNNNRLSFYLLLIKNQQVTFSRLISDEALMGLFLKLNKDEIITIISKSDYQDLEFFLRTVINTPDSVNNFVNNIVENNPNINKLEFVNLLATKFPDNYNIISLQSDLIINKIEDEFLRQKAQDVVNNLNTISGKDRFRRTDALRLTNNLLMSEPNNRKKILNKYQSLAKQMQGHSNPTLQMAGVAMAVLGAAVIVLGAAAIITIIGRTDIAIGIGVAGVVAGGGLFKYNQQQGLSKKMQAVHDEFREETNHKPFKK